MLATTKFANSMPEKFTSAQPISNIAPTAMIGNTPKRLIRCPVKNDGRNIATTCHWITVALSPNPNPQAFIASGVALITRVITANPNIDDNTAVINIGCRAISAMGRPPRPLSGVATNGISTSCTKTSIPTANTASTA